ncbi:hypothetical protein VKT23_000940 [Stygiomarasmius scandens]|uniref:Uncharacterized protein n=1 Tax=Marasmiellus scandens TaxID=2682957 RepID=A0ABR1KAZ4_9AGAR
MHLYNQIAPLVPTDLFLNLHHRTLRSTLSLRLGRPSNNLYTAPPSPTSFRTYSRLTAQRPISAYDAPLADKNDGEQASDSDMDAKINGIRVWYSSFSSIDWLHDAIKDSVRFSRLRRRRTSIRARLRLAFDRSLGWIVVTVVGLLTAVIAFLVVRSEQWLV